MWISFSICFIHGHLEARARGHLPPGNVVKCFLCCKYCLNLSRRSINALFWENAVSFWGFCSWTPLGDFHPSGPLMPTLRKKSCMRPWFHYCTSCAVDIRQGSVPLLLHWWISALSKCSYFFVYFFSVVASLVQPCGRSLLCNYLFIMWPISEPYRHICAQLKTLLFKRAQHYSVLCLWRNKAVTIGEGFLGVKS